MTAKIAFCSDCDFMSWNGYTEIHGILDSLDLPAGDSCWLFAPSGSDMALFTYDLEHRGTRHEELLERISTGNIDVMHSAGSYSGPFNRGYKPTRKLVADALDYLAKHARVPRIWTNHGDQNNVQNIGGAQPADYHQGDLPGSDAFIIDLLLEHGVEYFWLDRLLQSAPLVPYRVVARELCRSGHEIKTFSRYFGLNSSPNSINLGEQLDKDVLLAFIQISQATAVYQHWGCRHTIDGRPFTPHDTPVLSGASMRALEYLAELHHSGAIKIMRLHDMLKSEEAKPLAYEAQRIGSFVVMNEGEKADTAYFNQYHKFGVPYFEKRVERLGLRGESILDAGCGVGQWSFALSNCFSRVVGVDYSDTALGYLEKITDLLRQSSPVFAKASIEQLSNSDDSFDAVLCYGVIFCTAVRKSLKEIYRVLKPGGTAYVCLNGDGWYEYLIDVRFQRQPEEIKRIYSLPIWNATLSRIGGNSRLTTAIACSRKIDRILAKKMLSPKETRYVLNALLTMNSAQRFTKIVDHYSDEVLRLLGENIREHLGPLETQPSFPTRDSNTTKFEDFVRINAKRCFAYLGLPDQPLGGLLKSTFSSPVIRRILAAPLRKTSTAQPTAIGAPATATSNPDFSLSTDFNRPFIPEEFEQMASSVGFTNFRWASDGQLSANGSDLQVAPIYEPDYQGQVAVWECLVDKPARS